MCCRADVLAMPAQPEYGNSRGAQFDTQSDGRQRLDLPPLAVVLAIAIAVSFCVALWRRCPTARSTYWHGLVLVAGLISAAAFQVAVAAPNPGSGPVPDRSGTVCHSGRDNECVGG